jgi:hypothetical protein
MQNVPQSLFNIQIRTLSDAQADLAILNTIRHFLFQKYIQEYGWKFQANNPSGIRIDITTPNMPLLVDHNDLRAYWFYVIHLQKIIGCARLVNRGADGKFEVQRYQATSNLKFEDVFQLHPKLVEINRESCSNQYVYCMMLKSICTYCKLAQIALFVIACDSSSKEFYRSIDFPEKKQFEFKYELEDKETSQLFLASLVDLDKIITNLDTTLTKFSKAEQPTLNAPTTGNTSDNTSNSLRMY